MHEGDEHGVVVDDLDTFVGLHIPNPNALVQWPGHNVAWLGIEIQTEDCDRVVAENLHAIAPGGVPDADGLVFRGRTNIMRVWGPGQVGDALGVADEAVEEGERGRWPND